MPAKRGNEKRIVPEKVKKMFFFFLPYWILSFLAVLLIFSLVAVIFLITPLSQSTFTFISCLTFIAAEFAVAYFLGKTCKMPAVVSGSLYGGGLSLIMLVLGLCTGSISLFSLKFLLMFITGVLIGAFASIAGFNSRPRRRYSRYAVKK